MANDTRELIPAGVTLNERIERAIAEVIKLTKNHDAFTMCIPPQWTDTDILICDALHDAKEKIAQLENAPSRTAAGSERE